MSDDVEQIVARLSEAQRWAIEHSDGFMIAQSTGPACRCALQRRGLVIDRMYSERLTPLGLAVRTALLSKEGESADA